MDESSNDTTSASGDDSCGLSQASFGASWKLIQLNGGRLEKQF